MAPLSYVYSPIALSGFRVTCNVIHNGLRLYLAVFLRRKRRLDAMKDARISIHADKGKTRKTDTQNQEIGYA